jgi:hypothetical protein
VIVAGHLVVSELLGLDGDPDHFVGIGEGDRVRHPGQAGRNVDSELHTCHDGSFTVAAESVA